MLEILRENCVARHYSRRAYRFFRKISPHSFIYSVAASIDIINHFLLSSQNHIKCRNALVAQSVEYIHGKDVVSGSIPLEGLSMLCKDLGV